MRHFCVQQQTQPLSPAAASRRSSLAATPKSPLSGAHFGAPAAQLAFVAEAPEAQPPDAEAASTMAVAAAGGGGDVDATWDPEGQPAAGSWGASQPADDADLQQQEEQQQSEGQSWDAGQQQQGQQDWEDAAADPEGAADTGAAQEGVQETYTQEQVLLCTASTCRHLHQGYEISIMQSVGTATCSVADILYCCPAAAGMGGLLPAAGLHREAGRRLVGSNGCSSFGTGCCTS